MRRAPLISIAVVVVAAMGWYAFRRVEQEDVKLMPSATGSVPSASEPAGPLHKISINVPKANQPPTSAETFRLKQGDIVMLNISSDRDGMVMIHGLTDGVSISAGRPSTMVFAAKFTGRFEMHFHEPDGNHLTMGALEVYP